MTKTLYLMWISQVKLIPNPFNMFALCTLFWRKKELRVGSSLRTPTLQVWGYVVILAFFKFTKSAGCWGLGKTLYYQTCSIVFNIK